MTTRHAPRTRAAEDEIFRRSVRAFRAMEDAERIARQDWHRVRRPWWPEARRRLVNAVAALRGAWEASGDWDD